MTWIGLNKQSGGVISEAEHIQQSVQDILTTPQGSRVMRRDYGSELFELIDQPQTPALNLRIMAATVSALARWEPRLRVTGIALETQNSSGRRIIVLSATRSPTEPASQIRVEL